MRDIQQKSNYDPKEFKTKYNLDLKIRKKMSVKTQMFTLNELLHLDNCQHVIDLPLWCVNGLHEGHLFLDNVDQHLKIIYKSVHKVKLKKHPVDLFMSYSSEEIDQMMPARLKKVLADLGEEA